MPLLLKPVWCMLLATSTTDQKQAAASNCGRLAALVGGATAPFILLEGMYTDHTGVMTAHLAPSDAILEPPSQTTRRCCSYLELY